MYQSPKVGLKGKEERWRKKLQDQIEYCAYCQPYDEGEPVWIYGDRRELYDLMDDLNIPEESRSLIASHLICPHCSHDGFYLTMDIGVKTKFEKDVDKHMDKVYGMYGSEVRRLEELLENYPLLALRDSFAKRIYKEIRERKLPVIWMAGPFFRARLVESAGIMDTSMMYNPPLGIPVEARFNHAGQSHLYLASDRITAIQEVIGEEKSVLVWSQEFLITEKVTDILDLSFNWDHLTPSVSTLLLSLKIYDSIGRSDRNTQNWKPDYYLTRFIMDCAKSSGYNGIRYNSAKEDTAYAVVVFYPEKITIEAVGKPQVIPFLMDTKKNSSTNKV